MYSIEMRIILATLIIYGFFIHIAQTANCVNSVCTSNQQLQCCRNKCYNLTTEVCCDGVLNKISKGTSIVYGGSPLLQCCGKKAYNPNDATKVCCQNNLQTRSASQVNEACCGNKLHNTAKQMCCNGTSHVINSKYVCCNKAVYNPANELCCDGRPRLNLNNKNSCCGKDVYNPAASTFLCCNGKKERITANKRTC